MPIPPQLLEEMTKRGLLKDGKRVGDAPKGSIESAGIEGTGLDIAQRPPFFPQYNPQEMEQRYQSLKAGFMETPGYQPQGLANSLAYYGGKYGPTTFAATMGGPAGAAMGRSLQNLGQAISNQIAPGSAAQKTPLQLAAQPTTDALTQGILDKVTGAVSEGFKSAGSRYVSSMTGVKLNLMNRAFDNIREVMASPSVKKAGEFLGQLADGAGIKTGFDGFRSASGSLLGAENATERFSPALAMNVADAAKKKGYDALSPQEMYSTAELIRKAISAPKYTDEHGMFSQNFRLYSGIKEELEDRLEKIIPGYANGRSNFVDALTKEALNFVFPLNKNMSANQLKIMMGTGYAAAGISGLTEGYRAGTGKSGPAEKLLTVGLMSPLLMGKALQAGAIATSTRIPQMLGRGAVAAGSETLANALSNQQNQQQ